MIKAIDIHCHFNHGVEFDTEETEDYRADLEFLRKEHLRLNIPICAMAGTFSSVISPKNVVTENEYLYALSQEDPFVYQWVVIDPRNDETFKQAEWMLKSNKILGLKIQAELHGYPIAEYADKIFSFANDRGTIVLSHPAFEYRMEAADKYSDMKLILAHLGTGQGYYVPIIKNAKYQNIYTDTSGSASNKNNVIEYSVEQIGSEKILFGTDSYSCAFQRGRIDYADIRQEDKEDILYKNALRLFPNLKNVFNR